MDSEQLNNEAESFRIATSELIGFGIVGTLIENAYEILVELDPDMADYLDVLNTKAVKRFQAAEALLFTIGTIAGQTEDI